MEKKVFRSRVSVLLMGIILAICAAPLIPMIRSGNVFNPGLYSIAGVIGFVVLLFSGMRYVITDRKLQIKMWRICTWSCSLSHIASVERSYNVLSSPAGSLKRLKIKGLNIFALVSPAREQEFLNTLKEANPDIYIRVSNRKGWWRIWDWDI
jgi:uncharacterized membrane protein